MPVTHRKLRRKELKQPDEFITFFENARSFLLDNLVRVIIGACAAIALAAIGFGAYFYMQYRDRLVADRFYEAITTLNHNEYKAAEADFSQLAVDHPGASLGQLARFYLASCYMAEKDPAKARDALNAYLAGADRPAFKSLALIQLGVAYEDLDEFEQARHAYSEAAKMPGPQKTTAELAIARVLVREGHKDAAIVTYRQFLKDNPFAQERTDVLVALAELGVPPEERAPTAGTPVVTTLAKPAPAASAGTSAASPSAKSASASTPATSAAQSPQSAGQPGK